MRHSEWAAFAYFAYVLSLALARRSRAHARSAVIAAAALLIIVALARAEEGPVGTIRDWAPALYLLGGYWATGPFFERPMPRWEARLQHVDRRLLDTPHNRLSALPRWTIELLELAYLSVYLLVPAGFAVVYFGSFDPPVDRFWTTILVAELTCYGTLPWIQTRPPRALEPPDPRTSRSLVRRLNLAVLNRMSVQVNTFPSGHSAGALAVALVLLTAHPIAGTIFTGVALAIAVASFVGRYHYAADAAAGLIVGFVVWTIVGRG